MIFVSLPVAKLAVSCDKREEVDATKKAAAVNGGTADINPVKDLGFMYAAESAAPPAMPAMTAPPAGQYHLDKSHASPLLRVSHLGFSTYTTRFSQFDADFTFDPSNMPASKLVTTIDAASLEMDAAPSACLDIVNLFTKPQRGN
jgi:YceI-like domain